ncbi:MAG: hypothetical protein AVDCRST_MAG77-990 [uncultured Chloroflexi bacterium]|uniref:Uncharacterized protein n=1 Tax=uncultured Chloroflexota bacterium TaxID=166587 RepID=A0A6J4HL69_9CHLR|nr:MAG: hypothetical protein AVDCRST_MAG77-990 [uncultured Chloroflexota bacterium]
MIDLGAWAETLGLRRKKTFLDRVQDAAGDVVESVEDVVESMLPVLAKPARMAKNVSFSADGVTGAVSPALRKTTDVAKHAWETTEKRAGAGLSAAGDMASTAASSVATGAAATGAAAAGVATGIGAFFGAMFSWLWWLTTFLIKAGLLVGIAYAGWQWLQSRKDDQSWNAGSGGDYSSSMYGSVGGSGSSGSSAPSSSTPAGAH